MTACRGDRRLLVVLPGSGRDIDQLFTFAHDLTAGINSLVTTGAQIVEGKVDDLWHIGDIGAVDDFDGRGQFKKAANYSTVDRRQ